MSSMFMTGCGVIVTGCGVRDRAAAYAVGISHACVCLVASASSQIRARLPAALGRAVHPRLANVMGEGKRLRVYPKNVHQPWPLALK